MKLPGTEDPDEIRRAVGRALEELDDRPRMRDWKRRAGGVPSLALVDVPRHARLDVSVPLGEMRVLKFVAEQRGISVRQYLRRALGTALVACDNIAPEDVPVLSKGGPLWPT